MDYRFILKPYRKPIDRLICPNCGRRGEFSPYVDKVTGELLNASVGRCNRENSCGYHYKPSDYFKDGGERPQGQFIQPETKPEVRPIDNLPLSLLEASARHFRKSYFYEFFKNTFTEKVADNIFQLYCIGYSNHWHGATLFPQIDEEGNFRQCQIILYNPKTGKRVRQGATVKKLNHITRSFYEATTDQDCSKVYGKYLSEQTIGLNLEQVFFGQHLVSENKDRTICVTESYKTAMVAAVYFPQYTWIATGGSYGCKWNNYSLYKIFTGRKVVLFPDLGIKKSERDKTPYEKWRERACHIAERIDCIISVSDLLEKNATSEQRENGCDLADFLLKRDNQFGWALSDAGYPIFWDYKN